MQQQIDAALYLLVGYLQCRTSDRLKALYHKDGSKFAPADLVGDIFRSIVNANLPKPPRQPLVGHVAPLQFGFEHTLDLLRPILVRLHSMSPLVKVTEIIVYDGNELDKGSPKDHYVRHVIHRMW